MSTREEVQARRERGAEMLATSLSSTKVVKDLMKEFAISQPTAWRDIKAIVKEWRAETTLKDDIERLRARAIAFRLKLLEKTLKKAEGCRYEVNEIAGYGVALKVADSLAKLQGLFEDSEPTATHWTVTFRDKVRREMKDVKPIDVKVREVPKDGRGSNGSNGTKRIE
jgi:hypothetical protein